MCLHLFSKRPKSGNTSFLFSIPFPQFCMMMCSGCFVLAVVGHYVPGIMISYIIGKLCRVTINVLAEHWPVCALLTAIGQVVNKKAFVESSGNV